MGVGERRNQKVDRLQMQGLWDSPKEGLDMVLM